MASLTIFGKTIDLAVLWKHVKSIGLAVAAMWASIIFVAGDFFVAKADGAMEQALVRQGMSPQDFKKMQGQISEMGLEMDNLGTQLGSLTKRAGEIDTDIAKIQGQVNTIDSNSKNTYDLLKTLIPRIRADVPQ